jgi:hypothetical protein
MPFKCKLNSERASGRYISSNTSLEFKDKYIFISHMQNATWVFIKGGIASINLDDTLLEFKDKYIFISHMQNANTWVFTKGGIASINLLIN